MPPKTARVFNIGDLVFAKIKGYPPWPARIEKDHPEGFKPTPGRYPVFFFGTYQTAVVISKDIFPYEQYKSQYGIERKKMKHFNLGLHEIEKTPNMSLSDFDENAPIYDEQPHSGDDDDNQSHKSDSSFDSQKSDLDNSSEQSSNYSASDSEDSDNKKGKRKNGKSTKNLSNKKKKKNVSSDEESDDDSPKRKKKTKKSVSDNKSKSKGKGKFSQDSFLRGDSSESEKNSSIAGSDNEVEKSPKSNDDNDSDDDLQMKRVKRNRDFSDSEKEEEEAEEEESSKSSSKSNEKADDHLTKDESDSDSEVKKKKLKRIRIDSDNSDSNESMLQIKKLKQKMEEKEREKERRKREKMEQKRQKRIAKERSLKSTSIADDQPTDIKKFLENTDQTIRTSLAINNPNVEKCLDALDKLGKIKLPDSGIQTYVASLKELVSTLRKCKKYKADQRVRDKSDFCLENFKSVLNPKSTPVPKEDSLNVPKQEDEDVKGAAINTAQEKSPPPNADSTSHDEQPAVVKEEREEAKEAEGENSFSGADNDSIQSSQDLSRSDESIKEEESSND